MKQQDGPGRAGAPGVADCTHENVVATVTAGLERRVCEDCALIQISFISESVKLYPDAEDLGVAVETSVEEIPSPEPKVVESRHRCVVCESEGLFIDAFGMACSAHAWDAASDQESDDEDLWIPLLIDRPNARKMMDDLDNGEGEIIDLTWYEE